MNFPWLGFIFWVGVFTWFGLKVWTRYLSERERQQTLRAFAERGTSMAEAAEALEKMYPKMDWGTALHGPQSQQSPQAIARGLTIGGVITLFAGGGLLIAAQLMGQIDHEGLIGMSVGGVMAATVGLGLLVAALITRRAAHADEQAARSGTDDTHR